MKNDNQISGKQDQASYAMACAEKFVEDAKKRQICITEDGSLATKIVSFNGKNAIRWCAPATYKGKEGYAVFIADRRSCFFPLEDVSDGGGKLKILRKPRHTDEAIPQQPMVGTNEQDEEFRILAGIYGIKAAEKMLS